MASAETRKETTRRQHVGRPRRLTLERIIDAARELGPPAAIEMTAVAKRLGVGIATLYNYVRNRDELIRLVAVRRASLGRIEDRGQSWQDIMREHAGQSFASYAEDPEIMQDLLRGTMGATLEAEYVDRVLGMLFARGLSPAEAVDLYKQTNQIVIGASVGAAFARSIARVEGGYAAVLRRALAAHADHELPHLRRCADLYVSLDRAADYRPNLERLLAAFDGRARAPGN